MPLRVNVNLKSTTVDDLINRRKVVLPSIFQCDLFPVQRIFEKTSNHPAFYYNLQFPSFTQSRASLAFIINILILDTNF